MNTPISSIRNLGPAYEEACRAAGIHSAEELREIGADAAYARLLRSGTRPHFIGYYALVMALQGRRGMTARAEKKKSCANALTRSRRRPARSTTANSWKNSTPLACGPAPPI